MIRSLEPNRRRYFSTRKKSRSCIFCNARNIRAETCKNLETRHWRVWVNQFPYLDGNVMLVPKRHAAEMGSLTRDEWAELHGVLRKTMRILGKLFKTRAFNMAANFGKKSGGSIAHLHWQLLPRHGRLTPNSFNIFENLYVITVSPQKLKRMIEKGGPRAR